MLIRGHRPGRTLRVVGFFGGYWAGIAWFGRILGYLNRGGFWAGRTRSSGGFAKLESGNPGLPSSLANQAVHAAQLAAAAPAGRRTTDKP